MKKSADAYAEFSHTFRQKLMMKYSIRKINESEYHLLDDFLYEAIFIPEGVEAPPRSIISDSELQVYVNGFGQRFGDHALVAEVEGIIVGAVWTRIMNDYGHVGDETPSIAISVYKDLRQLGIGTDLMREMLRLLKSENFKHVSLAVQKKNYAVKMYEKLGFAVVDVKNEEYIMVLKIK